MNPAIVAALIGEAGKAQDRAITLAKEVISAITKPSPMISVVVNNTPYNFKFYPGFGQAIHGRVIQSAPVNLWSLENGAVRKYHDTYSESNTATWIVNGSGHGAQVVMAFHCEELEACFAFWSVNPASGPSSCGIQFSDHKWLEDQINEKHDGKPGKATWLRDHMKSGDTNFHAYAKHGTHKRLGPLHGMTWSIWATEEVSYLIIEMVDGSHNPIWKNVKLPAPPQLPGINKENGSFQLNGRLMDRSGNPLSHHTVVAFDKDKITKDDHLASTTSDVLGNFSMKWSPASSKDLGFDHNPELYFKVLDGTKEILSTENSPYQNIQSISEPIILQV